MRENTVANYKGISQASVLQGPQRVLHPGCVVVYECQGDCSSSDGSRHESTFWIAAAAVGFLRPACRALVAEEILRRRCG